LRYESNCKVFHALDLKAAGNLLKTALTGKGMGGGLSNLPDGRTLKIPL